MEISRKVNIVWKYNPTTFEKINSEVVGEQFRKVGGSVTAVTKILQNSAMLRMLMPQLLGVDPDSNDVNWDRTVKHYWDSIAVDVPTGGKQLETGFSFDIDDINREKYITELAKANSLKTSEDLANYVMGHTKDEPNVKEEVRWKYGNPINIEDYLIWRYVLNYRHVANSIEDVNKSPNIRFYLHTQEEKERIKKQEFKTKQGAINAYIKFLEKASKDDINDVLSIISPSSVKDIVSNTDLEDKQAQIMEVVIATPTKFVDIIKDKNLKTKALIERLIAFNVLKRLPSSTVVVESADPSVTIGNNMDECVSFMLNEKNSVKINELTAKYKSLMVKQNV